MAAELRGLPVAEAMRLRTEERIEALHASSIHPTLGIVRVGARPDDLAYEAGIKKRFAASGAIVRVHELGDACSQDELEASIASFAADTGVHGILVFRPLPKRLDSSRAAQLVPPGKDVDCFNPLSAAGIYLGEPAFAPCTPEAVMKLLEFYRIPISGRRVTIVGRSPVVGKPLAMLMLAANATVTVCHTRTVGLAAECRRADVLVCAAGRAGMIGSEFVREGQTVADVGINVVGGRLCGDVAFEAVSPIAAAVTPVPGGIGTVTNAVLLEHTVRAAETLPVAFDL